MTTPSTTTPSILLRIEIPGPPVAQGRGRAVPTAAGLRVMDPKRSAAWKGTAQVWMLRGRNLAGIHAPFARPLAVTVTAVFGRPKAERRQGRQWRPSRPDADNLAKAVLDAGISVLWRDDDQVVLLEVRKVVATGGEEPHVEVLIEDVGDAA